ILFFRNEVGAKHASPLRVFPRGTIPASLSAVMQSFKSAATWAANRTGLMPIGRLWQRGFFERVIRNEEELGRLQSYIEENPLRWAVDRENPDIS
ncbi:MAG TPA: hypothetical protein VFI11_06240, partial [Anaerolineales bacterium]|nr:hypothetical protein [Anaerolineales bacterium]